MATSKRIKGIQIPIGADTTPLQKALTEVNTKSKDLNKELKQVNNLLKLDPKNTELLTQKQKLLSDSVINATEKIKRLKDAQQEVNRLFASGEIDEGQHREFNREIESAKFQLNKLEKQAKNTNNSLSNTFEDASQKLNKFGTFTTDLGKKLLPLSGAIAGIGASAVGLAVKTGKLADDINTLSKVSGLSTKEIQKFQYASDIIDVSLDTLTGSMSKLIRNMESARQGSKNQSEAFNALGISIIGVDGQLRNSQDVFEEVINTLGKIENETQRDAIAMQIFGKSAQELNPLILGGADALKQLGDEAERAGLILSQDALNSANEFNDELDRLKANTKGSFTQLGNQLATILLPALQDLAHKLKSGLGWLNNLDKETLKFVGSMGLLVAGIAPLLIMTGKLATGISSIMVVSGKLKTSLVGTAESVGLLSKAFTFLSANPIIAVIAAISALGLVLGNSLGLFKSQAQKIEEALVKTRENIQSLNKEISDLNSNKSNFGSLSKEFEELSKKTNKNTEETKRYYEVQSQLHQILPTLSGFYNEQGNYILTNATNYEDLNEQLKIYLQQKKEELALESKSSASATVDKYNNLKAELEGLSEYINLYNKRESGTLTADEKDRWGEIVLNYSQSFDKVKEKFKEVKDEFNSTSNQIRSDVLNIVSDTKEWTSATEQQKNAIREALSKTSVDYMSSWSEGLANGTLTMDDFMLSMRVLIPNLKELGDVAEQSGNNTGVAFEELSKRIEKFNKTSSDMNKVNDILQSLNKNGALTSSEVSSLLEISEDFVSVLGDESALRDKLNTTLEDYKSKHQQAYYDMIKDSTDYYDSLVNGNVGASNELLTKLQKHIDDKGVGYNIDLKNYETIEKAKLGITKDLITEIAGMWSKYFNTTTGAFQNITEQEWDSLSYKEQIHLGNMRRTIADLLKGLNEEFEGVTLDSFDVRLDSDTKSSSGKSDILKLYEERKKAIEHEIFLSKQLQATYKATSKEYLDEADKQAKKYKELQNLANSTRLNIGISTTSSEGMQLSQDWWSAYNNETSVYQDKLYSITATYEKQNQLLEDKIQLLEVEQSKYDNLDNNYIEIEKEKYSIVLEQKKLISRQIEELENSNIKGAKEHITELKRTLLDFEQSSINIKKNIANSIAENESNYIEKVKNSREKLEDAYIDMQKKRINETKKAYQDEIKWANEVFNTKKSNLQKERDERYKDRDLKDKTSNISSLEAELALIKNDETQVVRYLELQEELAKAKLELDDTIYDNQYEKRVQALEDEQNKMTERYEFEIALLEDSLNDEKTMRANFNRDIENENKKTYDALIKYAENYGDITSIEIKDAWDICTNSLNNFNFKQIEVNDNLHRTISSLRQVLSLTNSIGSAGSITSNSNSIVPRNGNFKTVATNNINNSSSSYTYETPINIKQGDIIVNSDVNTDKINELKGLMSKQKNDIINDFKKVLGSKGNSINFSNVY